MPATDSVKLSPESTNRVLVQTDATLTRKIPLAYLLEPLDPMRFNMDDAAMVELMDSIREHGVLQNLCVVPVSANKTRVTIHDSEHGYEVHVAAGGLFRVACGHRRLLACRGLHMAEVECKVYCDSDKSEDAIMAIENGAREEPSDYELAVMYAKWLKEPGITESAIQKRAGKSLDFIYARAEVLSGWEFVGTALHERKIKLGVARELNRETDQPYAQHFLNMAIDQGATVRLVRAWVSEHEAHKAMASGPAPEPQVHATVVNVSQPISACVCCQDAQSYNLKATLICFNCEAALKQARERAAAETEGGVA